MKKIILFTIILSFTLCLSACSVPWEKEEVVEEPKVEIVLFDSAHGESIIAKGEELFFGDAKYLQTDLDGDGNTEELQLGRNLGKSYAQVKGNVNTRILVKANEAERQLRESYLEEAYDEFTELKNEFYIQLTAIDLDSDGTKEIVASVGNNAGLLRTSVFRYIPDGENICEYKGFFISEDKVTFDGEKMTSGEDTYIYKQDALYKDNDGSLSQIVDESFSDRDVKEIEKEEQADKEKRAGDYFLKVRKVLKYGINTTYRYDIEELSKRISYYMSGTGSYDSCISAIGTITKNFDKFDALEIDENLMLENEWEKVIGDVNYCREELERIKAFLDSGDIMKAFQTAQSSFSNDLFNSCSSFQEKVKNRLDRLE